MLEVTLPVLTILKYTAIVGVSLLVGGVLAAWWLFKDF